MKILKNIVSKIKNRNKLNLDDMEENSFISIANEYIKAFGGKDNIKDIYSCSTRLRISLVENKLDIEKLKAFGAREIIKLDEFNYQIILGKKASLIKDTINKYLG